MKIKQLSKSGNTLTFVLSGASPAFANAIRRAALDDVPTMAVESVEFRKNSSALYDETVAHRLGLIPLKTDFKSYSLPSECKCAGKGCARCQVKLTLTAKGQKNGNVVIADQIKSTDPAIVPAHLATPIVSLYEGQQIEMEMTATLGTGKDHAKWSPGHIYFRQLPTVKISKKGASLVECERVCPTGVFATKASKLVVRKDGEYDCVLCGACVDASNGEVAIETTPEDYIFTVESWGQLSPKEIIIQSIAVLDGKVDLLADALKKKKKK